MPARSGETLFHVGFDGVAVVVVSSQGGDIADSRGRTLRSQRVAGHQCCVSQNHPGGFYEAQRYGADLRQFQVLRGQRAERSRGVGSRTLGSRMHDDMILGWRLAKLMAVMLWLAASAGAQSVSERQLIVIAPDIEDERVVQTRDAVAFWNRTLSELGLGVRFHEPVWVVAPAGRRAIETFARFVSQRGGRIPKGASGPQAPTELTELGGDVVVLLSVQPLLPFAWPLVGSPDYFVAIRAVRPKRPDDDTVLRNVIAHELGHTLGLVHNRGGASLMCGPCSSLAASSSPDGWLPLTARDRDRLRRLHPAR